MSDQHRVENTKHDSRKQITPKECQAIQLLHDDGWDIGVLAMVFEITSSHLYNHINDNCSCTEVDW